MYPVRRVGAARTFRPSGDRAFYQGEFAMRLWNRPTTKPARKASWRARPTLETLERRDLLTVPYVHPHGGMVLTHVQVETVYLGSDWQNSAALQQDAQKLNQYLQYLTNSSYMDLLGEYYEDLPFVGRVYVGRGSYIGQDYTSDSLPRLSSGYVINDAHSSDSTQGPQGAIENDLAREILNKRVAWPNDWETLYVVYLPPGVGTYFNQANDAVGYHGSFFLQTGTNQGLRTGDNVNYAVIPYPGQGNAPVSPNLTNPFDGQTAVTSHELAEAVTDPYQFVLWPDTMTGFRGGIEGGWYQDPNSSFPKGGEIGDFAEGYFVKLCGYVVQDEWSASHTAIYQPSGATPLTYGTGTGSGGTGLEGGGSPTGPIAYADLYQVSASGTLTVPRSGGVLVNDYDPYGNALQAVLRSGPLHGSLSLSADGSFFYTPTPGFAGYDTFSYAASDGYFTSNPVTVTLSVLPAATTTSLGASASSVQAGRSVTFTATVSTASSASLPGGYVSFYDGGTFLGFGILQWNGVADIATFTTSALRAGSHSVSATYSGDTAFQGSSSGSLAETVTAADATFAEFAGSGVWQYSAGGWQQLTAANAALLAADASGEAFAEFAGYGVWRYGASGWQQLTAANASLLTADAAGDVFAEFAGARVWRYSAVGWQQLTGANAALLTADAAGNLFAEFAGYGVWRYGAGGWQQLTGANAALLVADASGELFGEFAGSGLWRFGASGWQQLTGANAATLAVDVSGALYGEFAGSGVWRFGASGWQQLTPADAVALAAGDAAEAFAEFGGYGVWRYGASGWQQLTAADATQLATA
jgi:hypothetical protein